MKVVIILLCISVILTFSLAFMIKLFFKQKKNIAVLKEEIKHLKDNMSFLCKHIEEVAEIEKNRISTAKKIGEAENDEEVIDIINSIISTNNSRVRNK